MKTLKFLTFICFLTTFSGCKKDNETLKADENLGVIKDQTGAEQLNRSDVAFGEALYAYSNKDYKKAGDLLAVGAKELTEEAKTKGSVFKDELKISINDLTAIAKDIHNGQNVDQNVLRSLIANAEINVNHGYLASENFYILTEPEEINNYKIGNSLDRTLKSLEVDGKKLEGDAKKEGEKLEADGKKLKSEFEEWKKRVDEHIKKAEAHFDKNKEVNRMDD